METNSSVAPLSSLPSPGTSGPATPPYLVNEIASDPYASPDFSSQPSSQELKQPKAIAFLYDTIVIDDDDDDADDASFPEPAVQKPRAKKRKIDSDTANQSEFYRQGPALPASLPPNIAHLIRGYQTANKCTAIPNEIYCVQVQRIFKIIDKVTKKATKEAVYFHAQTGQRLHIDAFALEWMRKDEKKGSERLIVASGVPLHEPVALARTKPYSNEFRAWGGVNDDPSTQAIVVRKLIQIDDAGSSPISHVTLSSGESGQHGIGQTIGYRSAIATGSANVNPLTLSRGGCTTSLKSDSTLNLAPQSTGGLWTSTVLDATFTERATHTLFHFKSNFGDAVRIRDALKCPTYQSLFINAVVGGVISEDDPVPILSCSMTLTDASKHRQVVADEQDFREMVEIVMHDRAWRGDAENCIIQVSKFNSASSTRSRA